MALIQLAVSDETYRRALRDLLVRNGSGPVGCVEKPDLEAPGVLVLDFEHFSALPLPIAEPERIVLIADGGPGQMRAAWAAGVKSVVLRKDPVSTAALAVLSACLHVSVRRG